jgi:CRP-like cAMP-binding protein
MKTPGNGEAPQKVKEYSTGGYFGELALLKNEPRAASVIAKVI